MCGDTPAELRVAGYKEGMSPFEQSECPLCGMNIKKVEE